MAKVLVDHSLADTLKTIRIQNKVTAKDIATELNKSPSYISKLENGMISTISRELLLRWLQFISSDAELDSIIDNVFKTVSIRYSKQELDNMLWLYNFDTVYRRVPIPDNFAKSYATILSDNGISTDRLVEEINKNIFIPKELLKKRLPDGEWFRNEKDTYIKMNIDCKEIESILSKDTKVSNYVTLFAIVLYTLLMTDYKDIKSLDEKLVYEINKKARDLLEQYKIYTISRKYEIIEKAGGLQDLYEKLSNHDIDNADVIGKFNPLLYLYSYYDVVSANRLISEFTNNMEWDAPFIMEIAGMPFHELEHASFRVKNELLNSIRKLLKDTMDLPEQEKKREEYSS